MRFGKLGRMVALASLVAGTGACDQSDPIDPGGPQDTTRPRVEVLTAPESLAVGDSTWARFRGQDNIALSSLGVEFTDSLPGLPYQAQAFDTIWTDSVLLAPTEATTGELVFTARDTAGNTSPEERRSFSVRYLPPQVDLELEPHSASPPHLVNGTLRASDRFSLDSVSLTIDGEREAWPVTGNDTIIEFDRTFNDVGAVHFSASAYNPGRAVQVLDSIVTEEVPNQPPMMTDLQVLDSLLTDGATVSVNASAQDPDQGGHPGLRGIILFDSIAGQPRTLIDTMRVSGLSAESSGTYRVSGVGIHYIVGQAIDNYNDRSEALQDSLRVVAPPQVTGAAFSKSHSDYPSPLKVDLIASSYLPPDMITCSGTTSQGETATENIHDGYHHSVLFPTRNPSSDSSFVSAEIRCEDVLGGSSQIAFVDGAFVHRTYRLRLHTWLATDTLPSTQPVTINDVEHLPVDGVIDAWLRPDDYSLASPGSHTAVWRGQEHLSAFREGSHGVQLSEDQSLEWYVVPPEGAAMLDTLAMLTRRDGESMIGAYTTDADTDSQTPGIQIAFRGDSTTQTFLEHPSQEHVDSLQKALGPWMEDVHALAKDTVYGIYPSNSGPFHTIWWESTLYFYGDLGSCNLPAASFPQNCRIHLPAKRIPNAIGDPYNEPTRRNYTPMILHALVLRGFNPESHAEPPHIDLLLQQDGVPTPYLQRLVRLQHLFGDGYAF